MIALLLILVGQRQLDLALEWVWNALLVLEKAGVELPLEDSLDVYIAVLGEGANNKALEIVQALRSKGLQLSVII